MKPVCLVLAGPNGAGKSSLYARLDPPGEFINADVIAAAINPSDPEAAAFPAGREAMRRIEVNSAAGRSFTFETTLSGQQPVRMMKRLKDAGYAINLAFVALSSAELHISRVAQRVSLGGHHIDADVIRRRYVTSFEQLVNALPLADEAVIFDNSGKAGYRLCAAIAGGEIRNLHLRRSRAFDRRIAGCISDGMGLSLDEVWRRVT